MLVPDAVIVPQQLSMAPLVEATIVEETVLELPKEPPVDAPIEIPIEATRTHHETTHGHHEATRTIHAHDPSEKPQEIVIDGWAAQKLDAAQRTLIEAIRAVVRRVAPRALESAAWTKASAGAQRSFEFLRDAQVGDAREILEEASERVRHLRARIGEQLPLDVIERFLRDSVKKNDAHGSKRAR